MNLGREIEVARRLAVDAGRIIMEVYASEFAVVNKAGGAGPVTEADKRANELIVTGLSAAFPGDAIIAEETAERPDVAGRRCWFVDPLDGTREFVDRNGMFAVHIGLAVAGAPVAGVVYAPASEKLYWGAEGEGAVLEHRGHSQHLRVEPVREVKDIRLVVSRSHKSKKTEVIRRELGIANVREIGSVGLKAAAIAEGSADLYLHPSTKSSRWDSCAPEAVLRGAGAVLVDFAGNPYPYDGVEIDNLRGIVACAAGTLELVKPIFTRVARETGLIPAQPSHP